jgi:hypothetical protein
MGYSFERERNALAALNRRIKEEWRRVEERERDLIKRGNYDLLMDARSRLYERMNQLYEERIHLIQSMPPFTVWNEEISCLERKPVTPENEHFLR